MLKKLPKSPCYNKGKDCEERTATCKSTCLKYKQYEKEYFEYDEFRLQEYQTIDNRKWRKK